MRIRVVNRRRGDRGVYIGRPSPLGNPFRIERDCSRDKVILLYRVWLKQQILTNPKTKAELTRLYNIALQSEELRLACWCAPAACHGNVIREVLFAYHETQSWEEAADQL